MIKKYNYSLINSKRSYTVEQICNLFKDKKLHPQTIRKWINIDGLKTVSSTPKFLIHGGVLKQFLKNKSSSIKQTLEFTEFKCFSCKHAIKPKDNQISIVVQPNKSIKAMAFCMLCNSKITKFYKANLHQKLHTTFFIKPIESTLCNTLDSSLKTHINIPTSKLCIESSKTVKRKKKTLAQSNNLEFDF